jgi:hypothetical protein
MLKGVTTFHNLKYEWRMQKYRKSGVTGMQAMGVAQSLLTKTSEIGLKADWRVRICR